MNKKLYIEILLFASLVAFLHSVALKFFLYWTIEWFDIIMHFLGGFLMALIVYTFLLRIGIWKSIKVSYIKIFILIASVLIIGLGWELWELFVGFTDIITDLGDTVLDIIMDILGAFAGYAYLKKRNYEN